MSRKGSRLPSGPWSRLKPVEQDPLEAIGLVSKGDKRLLDHKQQEKYYTKIVDRYLSMCTDAGNREELLRRFAALELGEAANPVPLSYPTAKKPTSTEDKPGSSSKTQLPKPSAEALSSPANAKPIADIMMGLRKLREGIVASKRVDDFSVQAYLFCVRTSVMVGQPESYHVAILYLLRVLHPQSPMTAIELQEVVGILVLDTACRRRELTEAYYLRKKFRLRDPKVDAVLRSLVHDNWVAFRRMKMRVDGLKARIMEYAEGDMRMTTLKAFGRTYMSVERGFLERMTGREWERLKEGDGVGWELEGEGKMVRVRSPKVAK